MFKSIVQFSIMLLLLNGFNYVVLTKAYAYFSVESMPTDLQSILLFAAFAFTHFLLVLLTKSLKPEWFIYTTMAFVALKLLVTMGIVAYYVYKIDFHNLHFALVLLGSYFTNSTLALIQIFRQINN